MSRLFNLGRWPWRESLLALFITLPWLSLVVLGIVWLWQGGHVLEWSIAAVMLGLMAWLLRWALRRRAKEDAKRVIGSLVKPDSSWNLHEREAWSKVLLLAEDTPTFSFLSQKPILATARQTVEAVSAHFFPDAPEPWARFTLPEILLLAERVARDIRRDALRNIPGVRVARLDQILWMHRFGSTHGPTARRLWTVGYSAWRLLRMVLNPLQSVALETKDYLFDQTGGFLSDRLRAYGTRVIVLEVGRAAIDLYSGRLRLSDEELEAVRARDFAGSVGLGEQPVRILLGGQVNAGKSSLLNAMSKSIRAATGPIATTDRVAEHAVEVEGRAAVVFVDTVGIEDDIQDITSLNDQALRADLVLWVASALQPARAPDKVALDAIRAATAVNLLRRPPSILVALTHVDQLRPAGEWSPPYDVDQPQSPKAERIRAAIDSAAQALEFPITAIVPVALPPGAEPYNIDALWARLGLELDDARLVQLDRLRLGQKGLRLDELTAQIARAGRWVAKAVAGA